MQEALRLAEKAETKNEVPVGAIIVLDGEIIAEGFNQPRVQHDPTAHAEIIALRNAGQKINNYRLLNSTLYVTLEPCIMCAGAIIHARIKHLIYGAPDKKAGAVISQQKAFDYPFLNHHVAYQGGLLAQDSARLLQQFFQSRR